jgi:hypothetical protein
MEMTQNTNNARVMFQLPSERLTAGSPSTSRATAGRESEALEGEPVANRAGKGISNE